MTRKEMCICFVIFLLVVGFEIVGVCLEGKKDSQTPLGDYSTFMVGDVAPQSECIVEVNENLKTFQFSDYNVSYQASVTRHQAKVLSKIMARMKKE